MKSAQENSVALMVSNSPQCPLASVGVRWRSLMSIGVSLEGNKADL